MINRNTLFAVALPLAVVSGLGVVSCTTTPKQETPPPSSSSSPTPGKSNDKFPACRGISSEPVKGQPHTMLIGVELDNDELISGYGFASADYNFGDGSPQLNKAPQWVDHSFPGPGTYEVTAHTLLEAGDGSAYPTKTHSLTCIGSVAVS